MRDVLLLAAVLAAFASGWLLTGKLDRFLEAACHTQELQVPSGGNSLRLGFHNPTVADSIADALEQYAKRYPGISVRVFCGSAEELLKGLSSGQLDVIFLPETVEIPVCTHFHFKIVSLTGTPVRMNYGGLEIEPVEDGPILQKVLWTEEVGTSFTQFCHVSAAK